jgi:dihydroorotate dehydrogenase electron transfer subunit
MKEKCCKVECECKEVVADPFPMRMMQIEKIEKENSNVKSFYFDCKLDSHPGQFVMIWLPGFGEKPMSIGRDYGDKFQLAIADAGEITKAICCAEVGQYVGIRGPLGKGFSLIGREGKKVKSLALVGGGYGSGPMASLAELALKEGIKAENIHFIVGARNEELLLFHKRLDKTGVNVHITTDDGSSGNCGRVTDSLRKVIEENKIDKVCTVGPEMMMKAVYDIAEKNNLYCEVSMERYMKCGVGVCGSCVVDPTGERMCVEGPVVGSEKIAEITEFGVYHRDSTGCKVSYK